MQTVVEQPLQTDKHSITPAGRCPCSFLHFLFVSTSCEEMLLLGVDRLKGRKEGREMEKLHHFTIHKDGNVSLQLEQHLAGFLFHLLCSLSYSGDFTSR